jgi:glycosyltransferase involved in cell wall biosynthesis
MAYPLVSILIVVKDGERFLPSALESIEKQAYSPIELILVDGHSTDRTSEIAKAVDGLRYLSQIDERLANARNCALRAAAVS